MLKDITSALRPALVMTLLFALLLGLAYPALLTGVGQLVFPYQANGSLIRQGDRVVGSELIAQRFSGAGYFHPRPSAAGAGYEADNSYGSNLGPTSQALHDRVKADLATLGTSPDAPHVPPADLVTTSASGLDPHVSPEAALFQVDRVAKARGLPTAQVRALVAGQTERPLLGILGEPRVNVLMLNRTLDTLTAKTATKAP
ncbi:MAG: potassium-transporting ATPase subunit KdpC [Sphingomonas sp.]|nr:potassium-transporting ATPase subunit KdpC [Sphingomonas sp.]